MHTVWRSFSPKRPVFLIALWLAVSLTTLGAFGAASPAPDRFEGKHYRGIGDIEYLRLLETARRFFEPDPELQNLTMLYEPKWNGFVEGPTWDAWWIQNSYGTTYSILPFLQEPFTTFLRNSHDLWFQQMGDGKRVGAAPPFDWVAPDGCLCDAARPGYIIYRQGDGRTAIHDWGMEFTAAGVLMQAELLLISRETNLVRSYLPLLDRCARFIESRRDPSRNLFLAGPAGNLLAPSYAGWQKPDGSFGQAYLTGLSVTWIAALDRLVALNTMMGRKAEAETFRHLRDSAFRAVDQLTNPDGTLIRSLDPDGTRHGVFGAAKHGYFEASPNHDAIAFRVAGDSQARRIYDKIKAIPELRPHVFILPNFPSYDDMYEKPEGLWGYGTWVNGGHWSTCEARMLLGYYRLGEYEDARRSMRRLLDFARDFRMDNPLTQCGNAVYQPNQPINLCYDTLGPAAAFMRGLFEYLYSAEGLTLIPHVPPGIRQLEQLDPVRLGSKRIYVGVAGTGRITAVTVNGRKWKHFDANSVSLPAQEVPNDARVRITRGEVKWFRFDPAAPSPAWPIDWDKEMPDLASRIKKLEAFATTLEASGLGGCPEAAHARLAVRTAGIILERKRLQQSGKVPPLPPASQAAADQAYRDAAARLIQGLEAEIASFKATTNVLGKELYRLWNWSK